MAEFLRAPKKSGMSDGNGMDKAEEPILGPPVTPSSNERLYSEVQKEFTDWYFSVAPEDFDEGLLDAYLEEMDELSPLESSFDSQASLKKFHKRFPSLFEGQKEISLRENPQLQIARLSQSLKKLSITAAIIIGVLGMLITAHAVGIDIFGAIGRWTEETFHFVSSPKGENINALSDSECAEYSVLLQSALDECGIAGDFIPTWCPEGFQSLKPSISKTRQYDSVSIAFQGIEDQFFSLRVTRYQAAEDLDLFTFEKDNSNVEQYTSGLKSFYILSNDDTITATWSDGLLVESISGNLTAEEVKTIIDSIGGLTK